jgi:hypothetical protein
VYPDRNTFLVSGPVDQRNPLCGRQMVITAREPLPYHNWQCAEFRFLAASGASVTAAIEDSCVACVGEFGLDLSPAAFDTLADPSVGQIQVTWHLV